MSWEATSGPDPPLLDVRDLAVRPAGRKRLRRAAARTVTLRIERGETYGVIGEAGSGAPELGRAIATAAVPAAGRFLLDGIDIAVLAAAERGRRIRLLRATAGAGRRTVMSSLRGELRAAGRPVDDDRLRALADAAELPAAALPRYPHELPDGLRRRLDIARALCTDPELVVVDDPVAGLDITVGAQLLDLLGRLQTERGLTYLLIARDLGVVRHLSDRVGVMYLGGIVEEAPARALYRSPWHPYTRALLSAVPVPDPEVEDDRERILLDGDPPVPAAAVLGCAFQPRCPWRRPDRCADESPRLRSLVGSASGHLVACHHADDAGDGAVPPPTALPEAAARSQSVTPERSASPACPYPGRPS